MTQMTRKEIQLTGRFRASSFLRWKPPVRVEVDHSEPGSEAKTESLEDLEASSMVEAPDRAAPDLVPHGESLDGGTVGAQICTRSLGHDRSDDLIGA